MQGHLLIHVTSHDLTPNGCIPCPSEKAHMALWNGHPKVYLDVQRTGQVDCPYCGTRYVLENSPSPHP
jgi:uncharacterized Zn-finger protein